MSARMKASPARTRAAPHRRAAARDRAARPLSHARRLRGRHTTDPRNRSGVVKNRMPPLSLFAAVRRISPRNSVPFMCGLPSRRYAIRDGARQLTTVATQRAGSKRRSCYMRVNSAAPVWIGSISPITVSQVGRMSGMELLVYLQRARDSIFSRIAAGGFHSFGAEVADHAADAHRERRQDRRRRRGAHRRRLVAHGPVARESRAR